MKTVLSIDSAGIRYFQRRGGNWRPAEGSSRQDTLWVLVDLPDESLEVIALPRLYGRDRRNFLERQLAAAFPSCSCRASHLLSGGLLNPGKVLLTGLKAEQVVVDRLALLDTTIVGLWGVSALLAMMAKRLLPPELMVVLPETFALRILVFKDRLPVLTRHVSCYESSHVDEIVLTLNHLKNEDIVEGGKSLPVLFLGDASAITDHIASADLSLLPVPKEFRPQGEAGWLSPIFNQLISSPPCQLLPLPWRARYLARKVRLAAYAGAALSLGAGGYFGQADIRALSALLERAQVVQAEERGVAAERERLAARIKQSGADPALVRRAIQFEAEEITAAPSGEAFLSLAAAAIAAVPEARVQTLSFHLAAQGEGVCQSQRGLPPKDTRAGVVTFIPGAAGAATASLRRAEVQLSITLPVDFSPQAKAEARKQITATLQSMPEIKLLQDPVLAARQAILKSSVDLASGQAAERWCLSVPWKTGAENTLAVKGKEGL